MDQPRYGFLQHILDFIWRPQPSAWDEAKNQKLKVERGIGSEEIVFHIKRGDLLDALDHLNQQQYGGQRIFVVRRDDYVFECRK